MVEMKIIEAGLNNFPNIVWYTIILSLILKAFVVEIFLPQHLLDIIQSITFVSTNVTYIVLMLFLRGALCFIAALLSDSYLDKFTISLISYALIIGISLTTHIVLTLEDKSMKLFNKIWENFSLFTMSFCLFGEASFFILLCEQFKLPKQNKQFYLFQLVNFWFENFSVVIGSFVVRFIRKDIPISGWSKLYLYPIAIGGITGIIFIIYLLINRHKYYNRRVPRKTLFNVIKYSCYLLEVKCGEDYNRKASAKIFGAYTVEDTHIEMKLLIIIFVLIPLIVMRQERMAYNWIYQFSNLDVNIYYFAIEAHEGRALTAIFTIILLPIAHLKIFPYAFKKMYLNTPLKYIGVGYLFLGLAYIWSAGLLTYMERKFIVSKPNSCQLRIYNTLPINLNVSSSLNNNEFEMKPNEMKEFLQIHTPKDQLPIALHVKTEKLAFYSIIILDKAAATTCLIMRDRIIRVDGVDELFPSILNSPKVFIYCGELNCGKGTIMLSNIENGRNQTLAIPKNTERTIFHLYNVGEHDIFINNTKILDSVLFSNGGVYSFLIVLRNSNLTMSSYIVIPPNELHFIWTLPQYLLVSISDVTAIVAMRIFLYTQSPVNLRATNFGIIYFIMSLGDILLLYIARYRILFVGGATCEAILIFIFLLFFLFSSIQYTYVRIEDGSRFSR